LFVGTLAVLSRTEARAATPAAEIHVRGFRWGWRFDYPTEGVAVERARDPGPRSSCRSGKPIRFVITSDDVIHSFYVPAFLFKRDVIPGAENVFDVTWRRLALSRPVCRVLRVGHSAMPFTVRAVTPQDYAAWLASERAAGAPAAALPRQPGTGRFAMTTARSPSTGAARGPRSCGSRRPTTSGSGSCTRRAFGFFLVGGLMALLMRAELAHPVSSS
jgi:heme/copper-type cytochrome/quinol oxidase subunit 2